MRRFYILNKNLDCFKQNYYSVFYPSRTQFFKFIYLLKYKIFGVDPVERYQNFRYQSALDKGEVLMDIPLPILTSFNGAFNINQGDNYKCYCATSYDGNGEYYRDDNDYFYGSSGDNLMGSKRNWEGKEARGTILDVRDMSSNETVLSAIATYNESFWNNAHDEIHTFNKYEHGFYCFALYRI